MPSRTITIPAAHISLLRNIWPERMSALNEGQELVLTEAENTKLRTQFVRRYGYRPMSKNMYRIIVENAKSWQST